MDGFGGYAPITELLIQEFIREEVPKAPIMLFNIGRW